MKNDNQIWPPPITPPSPQEDGPSPRPLSLSTRLCHLFAQVGFFLLGAYMPGLLAWLSVGSRAVTSPPAALVWLALEVALAAGLGGATGLMVLGLWRRRCGGVVSVPAFAAAALGYLLAISAVIV